jgi:hypothetical protein
MHEYKCSLEYALWSLPLATCFALYAAISARYGNDPKGPTYAEQEILAALHRAQSSA